MKSEIDPRVFARLMLLPDAQRHDLLEYAGSTCIKSEQLRVLIEELVGSERHLAR
jgi:hypothetical protein